MIIILTVFMMHVSSKRNYFLHHVGTHITVVVPFKMQGMIPFKIQWGVSGLITLEIALSDLSDVVDGVSSGLQRVRSVWPNYYDHITSNESVILCQLDRVYQ
eukprot:447190_1